MTNDELIASITHDLRLTTRMTPEIIRTKELLHAALSALTLAGKPTLESTGPRPGRAEVRGFVVEGDRVRPIDPSRGVAYIDCQVREGGVTDD